MPVDRLSPVLFPDPDVVRSRISENRVETRYLKRLLRLAEDAALERNCGQFAPGPGSASIPFQSPRRGA
jgi:hypothetical protein